MGRSLAALALVFVTLFPAVESRALAAEIRDFASLEEFRALVDRDKTIPRLVLLLSPT